MISIVPAIDIIEGRCVRLTKGDYSSKKVYDSSPVDMARRYADCGVSRIHLVDLDGAKAGRPCNLKALEQIASAVSLELEWGGGIADDGALRQVLNAGAGAAIIGSLAVRKPEIFSKWLGEMGGQKCILGADVRDSLVAIGGWQEDSRMSLDELLEKFIPDGLKEVICTDISKDGMLQGPTFELYDKLQKTYPGLVFTVSGGISSMDDIRALSDLGLPKVIVGKAIYENKISLKEIEEWSLNA